MQNDLIWIKGYFAEKLGIILGVLQVIPYTDFNKNSKMEINRSIEEIQNLIDSL